MRDQPTPSIVSEPSAEAPVDLPSIATEINDAHERAVAACNESLTHAQRVGELLIEAKKSCAHGGWLDWIGANCKFDARQAQRYMQVHKGAAKLGPNASRVSHLSFREALHVLAKRSDELARISDDDRRERIVANIESADSGAVNKALRDLGRAKSGYVDLTPELAAELSSSPAPPRAESMVREARDDPPTDTDRVLELFQQAREFMHELNVTELDNDAKTALRQQAAALVEDWAGDGEGEAVSPPEPMTIDGADAVVDSIISQLQPLKSLPGCQLLAHRVYRHIEREFNFADIKSVSLLPDAVNDDGSTFDQDDARARLDKLIRDEINSWPKGHVRLAALAPLETISVDLAAKSYGVDRETHIDNLCNWSNNESKNAAAEICESQGIGKAVKAAVADLKHVSAKGVDKFTREERLIAFLLGERFRDMIPPFTQSSVNFYQVGHTLVSDFVNELELDPKLGR